MKTNKYLLMLLLIITSTGYAMRCPSGQLVEVGDNQYDVEAKCGPPLDKQIYHESVPQYNMAGYQIGVIDTLVERWIYQRSAGEFQYILSFDQGVVTKIDANRNP